MDVGKWLRNYNHMFVVTRDVNGLPVSIALNNMVPPGYIVRIETINKPPTMLYKRPKWVNDEVDFVPPTSDGSSYCKNCGMTWSEGTWICLNGECMFALNKQGRVEELKSAEPGMKDCLSRNKYGNESGMASFRADSSQGSNKRFQRSCASFELGGPPPRMSPPSQDGVACSINPDTVLTSACKASGIAVEHLDAFAKAKTAAAPSVVFPKGPWSNSRAIIPGSTSDRRIVVYY